MLFCGWVSVVYVAANIQLKVAWFGPEEKISWEPASSLPQSLIDEFEKGTTDGEILYDSRYHVQCRTVIVPDKDAKEASPAEKKKTAQCERGYDSL